MIYNIKGYFTYFSYEKKTKSINVFNFFKGVLCFLTGNVKNATSYTH